MRSFYLFFSILFLPPLPPRCSAAGKRGCYFRPDHAAVFGGKQALCIRAVLRSEPTGLRANLRFWLILGVTFLTSVLYYLREVFFLFFSFF